MNQQMKILKPKKLLEPKKLLKPKKLPKLNQLPKVDPQLQSQVKEVVGNLVEYFFSVLKVLILLLLMKPWKTRMNKSIYLVIP
jgi:hypothetical protein